MNLRHILNAVGLSAIGLASLQAASAHAQWAADDALPAGLQRQYASSCVINDSGVDYKIFAGGYDEAGNASDSAFIYDPSAPAASRWTALPNMLDPRAEAQAVTIPGTDRCLFIGGVTGAIGTAALNKAEYFDLSVWLGNPANGWVAAGTPTARAKFKASVCGSDVGIGANAAASAKIIAVGGESSGTATNSIVVYNSFNNSWAALGTNLNAARYLHGLASSDTTYDEFLVSGGQQGSSPRTDVELIEVDSDCANPTVTQRTTDTNSVTPLSVARSMNETFREGSANEFIVAGGFSGTACLQSSDDLTVNWAANTVTRVASPNMSVERCRPGLVDLTGGNYMVIGGFKSDSTSATTSETYTGTWGGAQSLVTARHATTAQYLPSASKVVMTGGIKTVVGGATVVLSSAERR